MMFKRKQLNSDTEYVTLTPDDKITNGKEYLKALKWAIDEKKATNIALSGPYGSGKSSVIETFLRDNPSLKKHSIKISMATFAEQPFKQGEIQKSILKQLFYKVDYKRIPQSRYRKLHRVGFWSVFFSALLFVIASFLVIYVFWPSTLESVMNKVVIAGSKANLPDWVSLILAIIFILLCLAAISTLYRTIISRIKVKEVKVSKEVSFKRNTENQDNIFNKNMDEIVYFFEETKYRIVFFEDLDRCNNTRLFIHLRELNIILNNYDAIKEPIVFVYAVKDDIFTDKDRTKFFDFIIPIVPIINSTNSGEIILQKLSNSKDLKKEHNISESFVIDISPYISDMRILQNIYNEFVVYKSTLKIGQGLTLLDEPMLALIIFKNLYPCEFADLQMEKGVVKQAFKDKASFVCEKRKELQSRIAASAEVLESINTEIYDKRKSLKYIFLCEIANDLGFAYQFTPAGKNSISATTFLSDEYNIPDWTDIDDCHGVYSNWNGTNRSQFNSSNFDKAYKKLVKNDKVVSLIEDNKIEEERALIESLNQQLYDLSSKTLAQLIDEYGIGNVLSKDVVANDFLVFLLRRGYIDENYVEYINYFKATSITTDDKNYILGIKNLSSNPYDYKLTRTHQVIERLQAYEFEQEAIYNFDLLECLLSTDKYNDKLNLYIKQLSNGSETSWKFIDEFIHITKQKQRFINLLANSWNELWDNICNNTVLSIDSKFYYLNMIISCCSIETIKSMNTNEKVTEFFINNSDVLQRLSAIEDKKIINVINSLNIKFLDIKVGNVSTSIIDYIFNNNFYIINFEMVKHIVEYKDKSLVPYLEAKNYSTLLKLNYSPLLKYIEDNIEVYTDEIILLDSNIEEELSAIVKLLELNVNSKCRHIQIIENENFYVEDITVVCLNMWDNYEEYVKSIWDTIITNEKLKPTWHNLKQYWHYCGHTSTSIAYMCKNVNELIKDDSSCIDDYCFIKELIESDIDCGSLSKLLPKLPWNEFDIKLSTLDEDKVSMMLSQKYFNFDVERYHELSEDFPNLSVEFIINNQSEYMSSCDQIDMDSALLETLIFDNRFSRENAQCLIDDYGAEYMTSKIAQNLGSLKINIGIDVFDAAWELLDTKQKERLMKDNLAILTADKFESCFSDLDDPYNELSKRNYRHEVYLDNTDENLLLAKRLQEVSYITSYEYKYRTKLDSKRNYIEVRVICCRVKAI